MNGRTPHCHPTRHLMMSATNPHSPHPCMASFSSSNGRPALLPKDNAWLFLTIKAALFTCLADVSFAAIQTNPLCRPHQAIGCWILLIIPLALILLIIPLANKAWLMINAQGATCKAGHF